MKERRRQGRSLVIMLVMLLGLAFGGFAQQERPFELDVAGSWSWAFKYGFGDSRGLALKGYSNTLLIEGALVVDIDGRVELEWPISGILEIQAQLDNQKGDNLQLLSMSFTSERLSASFGDFGMGREGSPFAAFDRRLKGIKLMIPASQNLSVSGLLARVEGIKETLIFRGNTSRNEVKFSFNLDDRPWQPQPYLLNLLGLQYYELPNFVEGFTKIKLIFELKEALKKLLTNYGLGYLFDQIAKGDEKELEPAQYVVIPKDGKFFLILKREAIELLRDLIKDYIEEYNEEHKLRVEAAKRYPLNEGTDYELGFLTRLMEFTELNVDGTRLSLKEFARQRFYFLGREKISEDTIKIELFISGEFIDINDLPEYRYELYADSGILELTGPQSFFNDPTSALKVVYDYAVPEGLYMLGLSIVHGSERVYLNEKPLQRDLDYSIDYETGALMLLRELEAKDVLRIEYEIFRGGLGGFAEYKRNFSGVSFEYTPFEGATLTFDMFQTADSPDISLSKEQLLTMPNTHTVWGVTGHLDLEGLKAQLQLGYTIDRFPFDKNRRKNRPNRINVIKYIQLGGREYILFGHQNGLTVFDGESFSNFGTRAGLSGRGVNDIAIAEDLLVFATDAGISTLKIDRNEPLTSSMSKAGNWRRFYKEHGLASNIVHAAVVSDGTLYLGTEGGLNKVALESLTDAKSWALYQKSTHKEMLSDRILCISVIDGFVYLGTDQGLMIFDPKEESFKRAHELNGLMIHDILRDEKIIYIATAWGIRALQGGWLLAGRAVYALAIQDGELWYGTDDGLYSFDALTSELSGRVITALASSPWGLWIGSEALWNKDKERYELLLWSRADTLKSYQQAQTGINGGDEQRFEDISAAENTDRGWLGRLVIEHTSDSLKLGGLELSGLKTSIVFDGVSPGFLAVGKTERQDHLRLILRGSLPVTQNLSIEAERAMGLEGLERMPTGSMRDALRINFSGWPQIRFDYDLEQTDTGRGAGFEQIRSSYSASLSERLLNGKLSFSLGLSFTDFKDIKIARRYKDRLLSGSVTLKPLEGLNLRLSYSSPLKTVLGPVPRRDEARTLSHTLEFARDFSVFALSANWSRQSVRRIPTGLSTSWDNIRLDLRMISFNLGAFKLTPRGGFSLRREEGPARSLLSLTGEGGLKAELGRLTSHLSIKHLDSLDPRSRRKHLKDELFFRADYTGFKELRPSLDFQHIVDTLQHPSFGIRRTSRRQLNFRLGWTPNPLLENNLSLSWQEIRSEREETLSISLRNTAVFTLFEMLSPTLEATASFSKGRRFGKEIEKFEAELTLETNYQLSQDWSLAFEAGYLLGVDAKDKAGSYQSFIASLQIAMTF